MGEVLISIDPSPAAGNRIIGYREGGQVLTFQERVVSSRVKGQGYPREGENYVFFLKKADDTEDFRILTAYLLRRGRVFPIDGRQFEGQPARLPNWGLTIEEFRKLVHEGGDHHD